MTWQRRNILAALGAVLCPLGVSSAFGQAIGRQSDPYAQVDPYDDPRNGFGNGRSQSPAGKADDAGTARQDVFEKPKAAASTLSEAEAQQNFAAVLKEEKGAYADSRVQDALAQFVTPMIRACDAPDLKWQAVMANSESVNAMAMPGGKICVLPGLVRRIDSAGGLLAVLGHEIGHVVRGHGEEDIRMKLALLRTNPDRLNRTMPVNGGKPASIGEILVASFTRQQEFEADAYGMVMLDRLGWDPVYAIRMIEMLSRVSGDYGHHRPSVLTEDHPSNSERIDAMQRLYAGNGYGSKTYSNPMPPGWATLKQAFPTLPGFKNG